MEENKGTVASAAVATEAAPENAQGTNASYADIVRTLIASGCRVTKGAVVRTCSVTHYAESFGVSFSVNKPVANIVDGERREDTPFVSISGYSLMGFLKDTELAWAVAYLKASPDMIPLLFTGAVIDFIDREYAAGEDVTNPFSANQGQALVYPNDLIIHDIIDIKLSARGEKMMEKLSDKIFEKALGI